MQERILIVEDDAVQRETLGEALSSLGEVILREDGKSAIAVADNDNIAVAICDLVLPGELDGLQLLHWFSKTLPDTSVILVTGHATVETALEAMKSGAYDYLVKPIDIRRLRVLVQKALERYRISAERRRLLGVVKGETALCGLVGTSEPMRNVFRKIRAVARMDTTVLITGESGTGKELVAEAIHELSGRKGKLVKVNCSAIPENLLESELFGYERGAFTGALRKKQGKFDIANNGTIFLDEIGEMPVSLQAKILRTLETGEVEPLGATKSHIVNVRIIAATNRDIKTLLDDGLFRKDLYYRLMVFPIELPPLRQRKEDIPLLVSHFLKQLSAKLGKKISGISKPAMDLLMRCQWNGNVRQLRNVLEEMAILSSGEILDQLPSSLDITERSKTTMDEVKTIEELEREAIMLAMKKTNGNKTKAAKMLGIGVRTLYRKLEKFGIE